MSMAPGVGSPALALVGLLTHLAYSPSPPPAKAQPRAAAVEDTTKLDAAREAQDIARRFPKLARHYHGKMLDPVPDSLFRVKRLEATELAEAFPAVRFYKYLSPRIPPEVYGFEVPTGPRLMAVTADTFYDMSLEFNRLLFATGSLLNDSNTIKMAKAFVMLATVLDGKRDAADPLGIPGVVILDAKDIKRTAVDGDTYDVYVKARVGDEVQERYFEKRFSQFRSIYMKNPHLEEDMKKPPGLNGSVLVIGYFPDFPLLVNPRSGEFLPGFPGTQQDTVSQDTTVRIPSRRQASQP
jgi:hypothetical protein